MFPCLRSQASKHNCTFDSYASLGLPIIEEWEEGNNVKNFYSNYYLDTIARRQPMPSLYQAGWRSEITLEFAPQILNLCLYTEEYVLNTKGSSKCFLCENRVHGSRGPTPLCTHETALSQRFYTTSTAFSMRIYKCAPKAWWKCMVEVH
eukprot:282333-Pelagomonas_calceolata.AAC.2